MEKTFVEDVLTAGIIQSSLIEFYSLEKVALKDLK